MKARNKKTHKKIIFGMLFAIVISFISYSYAIASTTFSASSMELKNSEIADLQTEVAELELEYFSIVNDLSIGNAQLYGLEEIKNIGYVSLEKDTRVAYNY